MNYMQLISAAWNNLTGMQKAIVTVLKQLYIVYIFPHSIYDINNTYISFVEVVPFLIVILLSNVFVLSCLVSLYRVLFASVMQLVTTMFGLKKIIMLRPKGRFRKINIDTPKFMQAIA